MSIGPVQLIVLGFKEPDFHGEIIAELERLSRRSSPTRGRHDVRSPQDGAPHGPPDLTDRHV
jgi:hypothetical protein